MHILVPELAGLGTDTPALDPSLLAGLTPDEVTAATNYFSSQFSAIYNAHIGGAAGDAMAITLITGLAAAQAASATKAYTDQLLAIRAQATQTAADLKAAQDAAAKQTADLAQAQKQIQDQAAQLAAKQAEQKNIATTQDGSGTTAPAATTGQWITGMDNTTLMLLAGGAAVLLVVMGKKG